MKNTSYGGEKLFASGGKFTKEMNFQIGSTADEKMTVDLSKEFKVSASGASGAATSMIDADGNFTGISASGSKYLSTVSGASGASATTTIDLKDAEAAQAFMKDLESTLNSVGNVRAKLGANINRLGHTAANLANMKDNTDLAIGNIQNADFASEASSMTQNQMLVQTSMSMLKQSNSMSGMVMSLLG